MKLKDFTYTFFGVIILLSFLTGVYNLFSAPGFAEVPVFVLQLHIVVSILYFVFLFLNAYYKNSSLVSQYFTGLLIFHLVTGIFIFIIRYNAHTLLTAPFMAETHFWLGVVYVLFILGIFVYGIKKA